MDFTTQTPAQIDTRLAELEYQDARLTDSIAREFTGLRSALGQRQERITLRNGKTEWVWLISSYDTEREAVESTRTEVQGHYQGLHALRQEVLVNRAERAKISAEFTRRGGWTRAFTVVGGHIHSSRSCGTCYPTTRFQWLPQVSGLNEAEIVELAGERACTICYPSAPVNVLKQACRLWSKDEQEVLGAIAKRDAEKAERAAAKAAKSITRPDGSPLRGEYGVIATEIAARNAVLGAMNSLLWYNRDGEEDHPYTAQWVALIDDCIEALAHKQGRDFADVAIEFKAKAEKKYAKEIKSS